MTWFNLENIDSLEDVKRAQNSGMKSKFKKLSLDIAKKSTAFRTLSRKALFAERKFKYNKLKSSIATDDKLILFSCFDGKGYADSSKAIYEYMLSCEKYNDYTFVWAFKKPKKFKNILKNERTFIVKAGSQDYEETCARAKYWMFNHRIADHIYPKDDQIYVQLWHGTPLKKLGYDIEATGNAMNSQNEIRSKYDTDSAKFKYIIAPSEFAREKFISAWNLKAIGKESGVIVEGYPRNDYLINCTETKEGMKKKLGLPVDKKVILYAPTWRDDQHDSSIGYVYKPEMNFERLKQKIGDDYVIAFRAHYLVANSFDFEKYEGFVYDVSKVNDINKLYIASDLLITDYSSVFFDFANLKRPMIFYMYDFCRYDNDTRGFYIDVDELPGPIVKTTGKLIDLIREIDVDSFECDEKYLAFNKKYNYLDDGEASKRVVERIIG